MKKISKNTLFITIVSLLVIIIFHYINFDGHLGPGDNTTYANLARNIARGNGIAHNTASIPEVIANNGFPNKDCEQPIGWPLVLSIFMILGAFRCRRQQFHKTWDFLKFYHFQEVP